MGGIKKVHMFDLNQYISQNLMEKLDESGCGYVVSASEG
jgi:hypothetical protein